MPKVCPPGFICIENMTIIFLIIIFILAGVVYYYIVDNKQSNKDVVYVTENVHFNPNRQNNMFSMLRKNILMNPFAPPLKNRDFISSTSRDPRGIPININTRGTDESYRQMGILTRSNGQETILPVMGRALYHNSNKWQYYTMSDKTNAIKLPMSHNGRSCTSQYGCDELTSGDTVYVEGYKDAFKVTIYENSQPRYIPYL